MRFFDGRDGDDSAASTLREVAARFRSLRRFAVGGISKGCMHERLNVSCVSRVLRFVLGRTVLSPVKRMAVDAIC